jgi:hypothetical protein
MEIRSRIDPDMLIGGLPFSEQLAKTNLYPTAFPFDRCAPNGGPSPVAFLMMHALAAGVTSEVDIWQQAIVRTFPAAGFTIGVSSSDNTADTAAGTGARTVEIDLLDTSYVPHTITLTLLGNTKVSDTAYVGTAFRINHVRVMTTGTGGANAGTIYVYDASDTVTAGVPQTATKIFDVMTTTYPNESVSAFYTVPAGCRLLVTHIMFNIADANNTAKSALCRMFRYKYAATARVPSICTIVGQIAIGTGPSVTEGDYGMIIEEKTDLTFRGSSSASTAISIHADVVLYHK